MWGMDRHINSVNTRLNIFRSASALRQDINTRYEALLASLLGEARQKQKFFPRSWQVAILICFGMVRLVEKVSLLHGWNIKSRAFGFTLGSIIDLSTNQATKHIHNGRHIPQRHLYLPIDHLPPGFLLIRLPRASSRSTQKQRLFLPQCFRSGTYSGHML